MERVSGDSPSLPNFGAEWETSCTVHTIYKKDLLDFLLLLPLLLILLSKMGTNERTNENALTLF